MKRLYGVSRKVLLTILFLALVAPLGIVAADRIVIYGEWIESSPNIDGVFTPGEWSNPQLYIEESSTKAYTGVQSYVYFANNRFKLFVLVDAINDTTDDANDECLLWFNSSGVFRMLSISGGGGTLISTSDFTGAIGYGESPNNAANHKIYEWSILLSFINAMPGQSIDFCSPFQKGSPSMPYDYSTGKDNVWPDGLIEGDMTTWGILALAFPKPVGGYLTSIGMLVVLSPYLTLAIMVGIIVVGVVAVMKKRRN